MAKPHIYSDKLGKTEDIALFLRSLGDLYKGLVVFEKALRFAEEQVASDKTPEEILLRAIFGEEDTGIDFRKHIGRAIAVAAPMEVTAVNFNSPGFWEFLGEINPLVQIREYINERHERKKDEMYRMSQEKRKNELLLEKMKLSNLREQINILREIGVSEAEIQAALTQLILYPMRSLSDSFHKELIKSAEIVIEDTENEEAFEHEDA